MRLSPLLGRIAYAILIGVITFVVLLIIGAIVHAFNAQVGNIIEDWAALVGLLVGIVTFFTKAVPPATL